mmetsp:Transcript_29412/g.71041  ORF Transcript_29412/g.71041 Transcript_29412/m.71041 type:complete len:296 (-) Transcript_29412:214-1101(-)
MCACRDRPVTTRQRVGDVASRRGDRVRCRNVRIVRRSRPPGDLVVAGRLRWRRRGRRVPIRVKPGRGGRGGERWRMGPGICVPGHTARDGGPPRVARGEGLLRPTGHETTAPADDIRHDVWVRPIMVHNHAEHEQGRFRADICHHVLVHGDVDFGDRRGRHGILPRGEGVRGGRADCQRLGWRGLSCILCHLQRILIGARASLWHRRMGVNLSLCMRIACRRLLRNGSPEEGEKLHHPRIWQYELCHIMAVCGHCHLWKIRSGWCGCCRHYLRCGNPGFSFGHNTVFSDPFTFRG